MSSLRVERDLHDDETSRGGVFAAQFSTVIDFIGSTASTEREVGQKVTIEIDGPGARIPLQRAAVDERHALRSVQLELHLEFPSVPIDQVTILVECLWSHFDGAPVRDFLPLLVRKQAKEELLDRLGPRAEATVSP